MKPIFSFAVLPLTAMIAGMAGPAPAQDEVELPEGYERTGETRTCLPLSHIDSIDAITDEVFLVEAGSDLYINEVSGTCNGASRGGSYIEYKTGGSQLCANQIVHVKDNGAGGFVRGSCALGTFELLQEAQEGGAE